MFKEKCCKQCGQVYGHHDKMAHTKTQSTSQNTKYTKTFTCKHSLNTSLSLHKVSQVLKGNLFCGASYFHTCLFYELEESCICCNFFHIVNILPFLFFCFGYKNINIMYLI